MSGVDLVQWLTAQLDADAAPIPMPAWHKGYCMDSYVEDGRCGYCGADEDPDNVTYQERSPQALLEVEAKRQLLDEHQDVNDGSCGTCVDGRWGYPTHGGSSPQRFPCRTLRLLALPYAGRDGYLPEWAPTA